MKKIKGRRRALALLVLALFAVLCMAVPALAEEGESFADTIANTSHYYNTFWALVPSLVAIILAIPPCLSESCLARSLLRTETLR